MMNSTFLKKALPHIIAIAVFLIVAVVYCRPTLQGKVVSQSDVLQWKEMAQQSFEYKDKTGHFPLWTESTFSGMPAYTIAMDSQGSFNYGYLGYLLSWGLPQPISFFFIACVCFYLLMVVLKVNPWVGVLASLAYAYCSYDPVIIVTGHITKMQAIAYAPGLLAALLLLFQRRWLWGTFLLALFVAFQLQTQHLQIVYYTFMSMGLLTVFYLANAFRLGEWRPALIAIGLAAVAVVIGYGTSTVNTMPVQEYSNETMRGGRTELTNGNSKLESKTGLSVDYAFQWSYGVGETLTLIVPDIYGGGSANNLEIGDNSKFAEKMSEELGAPEDTGIQFANGYAYWGALPFTTGTVYLGAVICFLAILGFVFLKDWTRWWLLSVIVVGIVLSWGKNFPALNNFLFDHFPFYNKFRAPSTALFMPQLAVPVLVALGLNYLLTAKVDATERWKKFKTASFVTGGLLVVLIGFYFMASYQGEGDIRLKDRLVQMKTQQLSQGRQGGQDTQQQAIATGNSLLKGLQADRQTMYGSDLLRTIILIVLAGALVAFYLKGRIKQPVLLAGLLVLSSYDLLAVASRYLSQDSFVEQADFDSAITPGAADTQIKNDPDKNFRVLDESGGDPFADAKASYFHNSVGGYSPAKLGLYQDLIDHQLSKGNMQVYDMLNTKYFIQADQRGGQPVARLNPGAFGPCWLVKAIHYVKDGNEEMKALDSINVKDTAIVQQRFASLVKAGPVPDSTASIRLENNLNDKIIYKSSAKTNQFAVFSEIYYDKGWNAFIDGQAAGYLRVDYVLRGMSIPAGEHTIEFRFEPRSYTTGIRISIWSSVLIYLLLIATIAMEWKNRNRQHPTHPTAPSAI
jgi:Bacterial membrane protein YfhO